ncbi:MAG: DUF6526 family protein [Holophaga sp.]|jgi:hypothetical protein
MTVAPQTYANHKRVDPWYHYVGFTLGVVALVAALVRLVLGHRGVWYLVVTALLLIVFIKMRSYALRVQDRIIRLEETLRLREILPPALQSYIQQLAPGQFIALRFASDEELPARVAEALKENLSPDQIKRRIQTWRPDTFRV